MNKKDFLLACLLHDLGKFVKFGYENNNMINKKLNIEPLQINSIQLKDKHGWILHQWVEKQDFSDDIKNLAFVGAYHHIGFRVWEKIWDDLNKDQKKLVIYISILSLSDHLSSVQRQDNMENEDYDFLANSFEKVWHWPIDGIGGKIEHTFKDFNFDDKLKNKSKKEIVDDGLEELKNKLTSKDFTKIYNWYLKYTYFITDDKKQSVGDISLFEHSKIVVATANLFFNEIFEKNKGKKVKVYENNKFRFEILTDEDGNLKYFKIGDSLTWGENDENTEQVELRVGNDEQIENEYKACIVAGEFFSIQNYILSSKDNENISKRLRGKSLLVRILEELIIKYILNELNLTQANVILQSGGKFFILAPLSAKDKEQVIKEKIYQALIEKFKGKINFNLGFFTDYTLTEIIGKNNEIIALRQNPYFTFAEIIGKLRQSRTEFEKYKLDINLEQKKYKCKGCGKDFVDELEKFCEVCELEQKIGEKIAKKPIFDLKDFEYLKDFLVKDYKFALDYNENLPFRFVNNLVPVKGNNVLSFEEMLKDSEWKYLRVIKGDIDFLGKTIQYGFLTKEAGRKNIHSWWKVSRLMTFSSLLEYFWGKYIVVNLPEEFKNKIYTVYAGGDDFVFIVHPQIATDFIKYLYDKFYEFVGRNDLLHFSLGISTFYHKTPVKYAIDWADKNLFLAKDRLKQNIENLQWDCIKDKLSKNYWCWGENIVLNKQENNIILQKLKDLDKKIKQNKKEQKFIEILSEYSTFIYNIFMLLKKLQKNPDDEIVAKITYQIGRFKERTEDQNILDFIYSYLEKYILAGEILENKNWLYLLWREILFKLRSLKQEN